MFNSVTSAVDLHFVLSYRGAPISISKKIKTEVPTFKGKEIQVANIERVRNTDTAVRPLRLLPFSEPAALPAGKHVGAVEEIICAPAASGDSAGQATPMVRYDSYPLVAVSC